MINRLKKIRKDELVRGSFILLIMFGLFNFFNYVFQVSMARLLGPADFGILATLMSLIYILSVPAETIQTIFSKYTSKINSKKNLGKIKDLLYRGIKKGFFFAFIIFIIFIPIIFLLTSLLKISFWLILLTISSLFWIFTLPVSRGVLQGQKKFGLMGSSLIIESIIKVILGLIFVLLGLKVYGAIGGVVGASIIVFLILFLMLKKITKSKKQHNELKGIYLENFPILISITSIALIYSLDIILARIFFTPNIAGQYAFVSLIGKVILFISFAITKALLPMSSENFEKGKNTILLFKKSVIIVAFTSFIISTFYFLMPELIIKIISLGSAQYLGASGVLFILGVAYSLLSLSNVVIIYKLSINNLSRKYSYSFFIFVLLEIVLFWKFHNNLLEFSLTFLFTNVIMFLYSVWLIKK